MNIKRGAAGEKMDDLHEDDEVICTVLSPMNGEVVDLDEIPDPAFSGRMLGDGVAVIPASGEVFAPVRGVVQCIFDTRHAFIFENEKSIKVFVHVGINSMKMHGSGFEAFVTNGQQVQKGEKVLAVDLKKLDSMSVSVITPIVITDLDREYRIRVIAAKKVLVGDPLFEVVRRR